MDKPPCIFVLPAPPLPLDQGYRLAAYDEIVQLSSLRSLHLLICVGGETDSGEIDVTRLQAIPGVESVSLLHFPIVQETRLQKSARLLKVFLTKGRILEDLGVDRLTNRVRELSQQHDAHEIHFSRTIMFLADASRDLRKSGGLITSFSAHNIEADETKADMSKSFSTGNYWKALWFWLKYYIVLKKELSACLHSRIVIALGYRDHLRLVKARVNSYFIPPFLHLQTATARPRGFPSQPSIVVLGNIGYHGARGGPELFLKIAIPRLKNGIPNVRVRIIGDDASSEVLSECSNQGISYEKYVADLETVWSEMSILAVPLLVDKGIRIRILEAAMRRIPVVCTRQAPTGFENPESFLCIAKDFESFASHCIRLLTIPEDYVRQQERIEAYLNSHLSLEIIRTKWKEAWSTCP